MTPNERDWATRIAHEIAAAVTEANPEACPGCGCCPGDGVTDGCNHEDGCAANREREAVAQLQQHLKN